MKTFSLSVLERMNRPQGPDFYDAFSDLRNSIYSDLGLSQSTLDSANQVINTPAFQEAVAGAIGTSTQGTPASAAIPNLASVVKSNPIPSILFGIILAFGIFYLVKGKK